MPHSHDPERDEEDPNTETPLDPPPGQSRGSIPDAMGLFVHTAHTLLSLPANVTQGRIEAAIRTVCEEQGILLTNGHSVDLLKSASHKEFWAQVQQVLDTRNGASSSSQGASPPTTGDFPIVADRSGAHGLPLGDDVVHKAA